MKLSKPNEFQLPILNQPISFPLSARIWARRRSFWLLPYGLALQMLLISGCAELSVREKQLIGVGVGVLAVGAVAIYRNEHQARQPGPERVGIQPVNCTATSCL